MYAYWSCGIFLTLLGHSAPVPPDPLLHLFAGFTYVLGMRTADPTTPSTGNTVYYIGRGAGQSALDLNLLPRGGALYRGHHLLLPQVVTHRTVRLPAGVETLPIPPPTAARVFQFL